MAYLEIGSFFLLQSFALAFAYKTHVVLPSHRDHQRHSHTFSIVPYVGAVLALIETGTSKNLYLRGDACLSFIYGLRGVWVLVTVANTWTEPRCLAMDEWVKEMGYYL